MLPALPSTPIAVALNLPLLSIIEVPLSAALPMLNPELLLPVVENSKFTVPSLDKREPVLLKSGENPACI